MRATIVALPARHVNGYVWKWRCAETNAQAKTAFTLYYDCVSDARRNGYEVEPTHAQGLTAPGGALHNLS